ncbi:hypothetical protein F383_17445 [Gossypium arboreum]|nr:hypothetical protein F383_32093 [Gossypium arboreum]KHG15327.1 hypothetical protein F383_17445 [Gossypium arboreum]
MKRQTYM